MKKKDGRRKNEPKGKMSKEGIRKPIQTESKQKYKE
jgi:hypothetical protein